jgi:hypothetical protein
MNNHPLLIENENKRLTFRLPLLICFAMFGVWQFGIIAYSGTAFSIDGRTPLPIDTGNLIPLVATGYICSIVFMIMRPQFTVWTERITAIIALLAAITLYFPISPGLLAVFYLTQCFCCCFLIGLETVTIVNLFTLKTGLKHVLLAYSFGFVIVAFLQNEIIPIPFSVFRVFMIITLVLLLVFFFRLPAGSKQWPGYVKRGTSIVRPTRIFIGLFVLIGLSAIIYPFGLTVADNIKHGTVVFYLSAALTGVIVYFLWKKYNISPVRSGCCKY